jgi:hypothetical protein
MAHFQRPFLTWQKAQSYMGSQGFLVYQIGRTEVYHCFWLCFYNRLPQRNPKTVAQMPAKVPQ